MRKWAGITLSVLSLLAMVGCALPENPFDIDVQLAISPDPPLVGPASVTVVLTEDGTAVSGASVGLEGTLTCAGMVPVFSGTEENFPGTYLGELEFTMKGDWVIIVTAHLDDGGAVESHFDVRGVTTSMALLSTHAQATSALS